MLSDCVISWLCMRILTLTWENLISVNCSQLFWCLSVERPDGLHWRPDELVVRTVLPWSLDRDGAHLSEQDLTESGRALSSSSEQYLHIVRTRATFLLLSEVASDRTSSIHRPDGDPTTAIKCPDHRFLFIPHKIRLFGCLWVRLALNFWHFAYISHISGIFLVFFSSVFFKAVRMVFIFGIWDAYICNAEISWT
jgi:hypothetical protein